MAPTEYRIMQDGQPVAWATNYREILRYALAYLLEGPIEVQARVNGKWCRTRYEEIGHD